MLRVTIWMNVPSFYQDELYRALVETAAVDLRVVFARPLPSDRKGLGWSTDTGSYRQRVLPRRRPVAVLRAVWTALTERDRVHIVGGIWAEAPFAAAITVLSATGSRFAIYGEAPTAWAERSRGRRLMRDRFGRWVGARPKASLLPIARFAERYYQGLGFRPERTYPFAYFRRGATEAEHRHPEGAMDTLDLVYVGQLIRRKGVDLLLSAMASPSADEARVRLTIVGDGAGRGELEARAEALGIGDRVLFAGVVPSSEIRLRIAAADVLALPSRWDGWGLVVNEAFSVGVPVVVSDRCGAADIVDHGRDGLVFRSEDVADLRGCIRRLLDPGVLETMAVRATSTGRLLTAERAAAYLVECLRHMVGDRDLAPTPPWTVAARRAGAAE